MQQFLLIFYVLFFATGFMGAAALLLLDLRLHSRLLKPLLTFQFLFLIGMGLIVVFYYLESLPGGMEEGVAGSILAILMALNAAVYGIVVLLTRRAIPQRRRNKGIPLAAQLFASAVAIKSLANVVLLAAAAEVGGVPWILSSHILSALAMLFFGLAIRSPLEPAEPPSLHSLMRAYGICALVFAPIGLIEFFVQSAALPWLRSLSLDHFFYLAWNLVSMSAAIRLFRPTEDGVPVLDSIPRERIEALKLSARETEMALHIARGLSNKEIASQLGISPATVRTHIYNLYQKAGARSRVELLNKLRA